MALDGIVIANLVCELNQNILNSRINKIAQPEKDELLFTLKGPNGQQRLAMPLATVRRGHPELPDKAEGLL